MRITLLHTLLAATLLGCGSDKTSDTGAPAGAPVGEGPGTTSGNTTGSATGPATGAATGAATGSPTGTTPGTTPGTPGPVRTLVTGCDPTWCTFTAGGGRQGGDLCSCVFDGADHPTTSSVEASCFGGFFAPVGFDLTLSYDLTAQGYAGYAVDTCLGYADDSAVAVYDADPAFGGAEVACVEDTVADFCAQITDPGVAGVAPWPTAAPGSGEVWIVVDEWERTQVWNGATPRTLEIELFTTLPVCGDSTVGPGEECDDGGTAVGDGCDDRCQREPLCGDGFVDTPETCDDGGVLDGDGCDSTCQREPMEIRDCDPTWCAWTLGAGPNGGDLCTCTIPAADHPLVDALPSVCGAGGGTEIVFSFDRGLYLGIAGTTCPIAAGDSVLVLYGDHPWDGAAAAACNDDANGLCSKVWNTGVAGSPADLVNLPPNLSGDGRVYFQVDEYGGGDFWDGVTDQTVWFEFSLTPGSICGDGTLDPLEACDDGNAVDGDGCTAACQPEPITVEGCDPSFCALTAAAGPNGGDLCTCTFDGPDHPTLDAVPDASCFGGGSAPEVLFHFDLTAGGYTAYAVDTCALAAAPYADSAVATFDANPLSGGVELACSDDANNEPSWCSKITDTDQGLPPTPAAGPGSGHLWVQVDEWDQGQFWDGATSRSFTIELIP